MKRWATRLHAAVYRLTGGRLLGRVGGQPVLLLETVGRHSGRRRTAPVQYLTDGASFVVVAANAGAPRPPAWWLNLRADAGGRIQVRADTLAGGAREAMGEERAALWLRLTAANRSLERAAQKAGRSLPVVVLTPPRSD
jgi:F420H(2)-dependent quinone reductase